MMIAVLSLFAALTGSTISGVVQDSTSAVVSGASIIVHSSAGDTVAVSGPDGRFTVETSGTGTVRLEVLSGGFATYEQTVPVTGARNLTIVLKPATFLEELTVTASKTEQRLGSVPASMNVLSTEDIRNSPAAVADDVLRQIPTFSLFRRTSSLSSHPTAQGVSLRGIGPSGVSRTLVLVDNVPFNDPFGGWVYWTRVPLESTDRIEIVDGSSSSLYGNYAMGGVINIVGNRATRRTFDFRSQYGNYNSPKVDMFGSDVWGKFGVTANASTYNTDGFFIVSPSERGIIDIPATVKFTNLNAKLDYAATNRAQMFFRIGYFAEDRGNGKIGEVNDTRWKSLSGGVRVQLPDQSDLQATLFGDFENFHSTFLAVTAASSTVASRSIVRLTVDQHVPTTGVGGLVQWSKALGSKNYFSAGTDWHWVDGESQEDSYNAATGVVVPPTQGAVLALQRASGGTQRSVGGYLQDILTPVSNVTVTLSARVDSWRNYNPHNLEAVVIAGTATSNKPACSASGFAPPTCLEDRSDTTISPKVAARYTPVNWFSVWGDVGTGFRAPTLNELYRQFRVGTVTTTANDQLGPERLLGGEAGISLVPIRNLTFRTTWYKNRIKSPVSNVTLSTVGVNVTQQRQNLGETQIWGLQNDVEYRVGQSLRFAAAYLYNQATITDGGAANATLVGKYLPQVPAHRGSVRATYSNPRYLNASVDVMFYGNQFDDDQNVRTIPAAALTEAGLDVATGPGLPGYTIVDLSVSRAFGRNVEVFLGAQNLLNQEYFVSTLPTTIGSPRLINGGVRISFSGR